MLTLLPMTDNVFIGSYRFLGIIIFFLQMIFFTFFISLPPGF